MSIPAMAIEVTLSESVPNLSASFPQLKANPNPLNTPPATGSIVVPNSPKGESLTPRAFTSGFNYVNTITSTEEMLKNVLKVESTQQGVAALTLAPVVAGVGGFFNSLAWTNQVQSFSPFQGYGSVGSKFS